MTITLTATKRDKETTVNSLRANGNVPAVVYGPKQEPVAISLAGKDFDKVLQEAGESTIVELTGLDKSLDVLIKDVDFDPVKQQITHVDFYVVEKGKEMTATVKLEFIGEAPVEASKSGNVNKVMHEVEVACMPADLPNHIDVDLSVLVNIEDKIHVSDLKVADKVKITTDAEDSVVVVSAMKETTEDEDVAAEAVDMDAIEVEQKGKGEEETEEKQ